MIARTVAPVRTSSVKLKRVQSALDLIKAEAKRSAKIAGLVYLLDDQPGITRERRGRNFGYRSPAGTLLRRESTLGRIKSLAIPPAWTRVWISPLENSHLQATGFDARGRKQYRYHPAWREVRNATKFNRLAEFGQALKEVRRRLDAALALPGLPREKVLACVIRLLDSTAVRIGNVEYAQSNGSLGLTTLQNRHVKIEGARLRFKFKGKSGIQHQVELDDRRLARIVQRCSELPGELLFQYVDDEGAARPIGSADVNALLKEWTGGDFTAKDFRTWTGTILFLKTVLFVTEQELPSLPQVIISVAKQLGNTPAVCRKFYVHPLLMERYTDGGLHKWFLEVHQTTTVRAVDNALDVELLLLKFLEQCAVSR